MSKPKTGCDGWTHAGTRWGGTRCGRPLRSPEQLEAKLCGNHLAGKKRKAANDEQRCEVKTADNARHDTAAAICLRLEACGVEGVPHYEGYGRGGYSGSIVIDDGPALAELLEGKQ